MRNGAPVCVICVLGLRARDRILIGGWGRAGRLCRLPRGGGPERGERVDLLK